MFDAHPMLTVASSRPMGSQTPLPSAPTAGSATNFGNQRQLAWGTGRGQVNLSNGQFAHVEALNALNAGTFRKFDTGPGFVPVDAR